jgi:RimJ/RimL family protein N-acetyltransferase
MYEILKDPSLYEFIGGTPPSDVRELTSRYEFWEKRLSPDGTELWLNWVMSLQPGGRLIGTVQSTVLTSHGEIAWTVGSKWQNQGYATEAAGRILQWIVSELGVRRVQASIHPTHAASIKVAERLGLRPTDQRTGSELLWEALFEDPPR